MAIGQSNSRPGGGPNRGKAGGKNTRGRGRGPRGASAARIRANQRKPSYLDEHRIDYIDYKDIKLLQKFCNPQGKILPRRLTRLTNIQQRALTAAVKRARHLALMPFVMDTEAY